MGGPAGLHEVLTLMFKARLTGYVSELAARKLANLDRALTTALDIRS